VSEDPYAGLVRQIEETRAELEAALAEPDLSSDRTRYAEVNRRWRGLDEAFSLAARYRSAVDTAAEARELIDAGDEEARAFLREAEDEIETLGPQIR
jgi:peptide chain release factor 1